MTQGRGIIGAVVTAVCVAAMAACGSSHHEQSDQVFLQATNSGTLSAVDVATRIDLGHQMCGLLSKYHGDTSRADAAMASGAETFTPDLVTELRAAATVAYCPRWR